MSRSRQLAAIMFTDIKGYTALMQENEERAVAMRNKHRQVFNSLTEKYQGRILQYYGDGTLSIFDSAMQAVLCGIELQRGFREKPAIPVRIGIHTGEIFFSEEEIVGDSVNVASRIESLAVPGSVFLSEKVYDEIKNQPSIQTVRMKSVQFKNVKKPMEVYALANEGLVVPEPDSLQGKTQPPPASPEQAAPPPAAAPFLATKVFRPPPRPDALPRPRLTQRLQAGLSGKMTLISAPAGFGKTSLLSAWAETCGRPVAWLSLDEADSDRPRFLRYLGAALETVSKPLGQTLIAPLQSPQPPPAETLLSTLINELAQLPEPLLLVLDDYHLIDNQGVDETLRFLLEYLPPTLHLCMLTREDPPLPLARMRARRQLNELRAADLRFSRSEASDFLQQMMGLSLSEKDIAALEERTEGWIAGLQMAALSLQGKHDAHAFIEAFTGSHRFVLDYLVEEVLEQQPEDIRHFLLQTSILHRLSGSLCDAVTGRSDSAETLQELQRENLFVIPLDEQRLWYRYHHLFAEMLQTYARQEGRELLNEYHLRAVGWFERQRLFPEAIRHALAADDLEKTADLLEYAWPEMDQKFQTPAWMKWLEALPKEIILRRPLLQMGVAWSLLNEGRLEEGERELQKVEAWQEAGADSPVYADEEQYRHLPADIATARAYIAQSRKDLPQAVKYAHRALELLPEHDHLRRGPAAALLGLTYWADGRLEEAHRAVTEAMENFRKVNNPIFAISGAYFLADMRVAQGRLREAEASLQRSLDLAAEIGVAPPGMADLHVGLAWINLQWNKMEDARRHLQKSEELDKGAGLPDWQFRQNLIRALFLEREDRLDEALRELEEAQRLYYPTPIPQTQPLPARKARLWIKQKRLTEAAAWAEEVGISADGPAEFLREYEHLTLVRLLLASYRMEGDIQSMDKATALLGRMEEAAETGHRYGSLIDILLCQALVHEARGDSSAALPPLQRALQLAAPEGFVYTFIREGEPLRSLLQTALRQHIQPEYCRKLLAAMGAEPAAPQQQKPRSPSASQALIDPLSERELEILGLIAQGLSNRQISERLYLALSTVKGHNRNIFDKLEVKRRTEAVARARELGILN